MLVSAMESCVRRLSNAPSAAVVSAHKHSTHLVAALQLISYNAILTQCSCDDVQLRTIASSDTVESCNNRLSKALLFAINRAREHILAALQSAFLTKQGSRDALAERLSVADACRKKRVGKLNLQAFQ